MKQALMEIKPFMVQAPAIHLIVQSPFPVSNHRKSRNCRFKITAKTHFHQDNDHHHPYFQSAVTRASFRFQESLRSEPLFVDPYAGCFAPPDLELDENWNQKLHHYCVGTRFIDDQLLSATKGVDGAKQVVLFTDGMDTRAYRLKWPSSTVIFDVSPQAVFNTASQKLQGFNGSRPSIWVFQGFPITNLAAFKEILFMVSSLAMKGCLFLGELPMWLTETQVGVKSSVEKWMYEIFMSYGFRVRMIGYDEVAKNLGQKHAVGDSDYVLFVAEHLRFSDYEMEIWRREFQRVEEEGDEDGFEEL
ncbi:putative S-adenosyl-L-methionine-dependent methyltransferase MMAR_1059 isoform X2 [Helianthus annuus]|uniref:putative S-adenosyl-L-methionine-dependent methyltransferase MMAR_1059 isoform X2 n=1 Tax=Helianthus annuus TaxID=4232 RepID=UPI000B906CF1|nr:putative S-adenosyl-L-methionine-dependent methyltransferase MMAR_1059 isoform X2 [Helianthus annuus]